MKTLRIKYGDMVESPLPSKNYLTHKLIEAGAPIKILRQSLTCTREYSDDEIRFTGEIHSMSCSATGDLTYRFEVQK